MTTRIYTRTGDHGQTGLFRGGRVAKHDPRVEAYGTVDELNAALGFVLSFAPGEGLASRLAELQALLLEVGAELATPPGVQPRPGGVHETDLVAIESWIDAAEGELPPLKSFIRPAGTPAACALHLARTICRRAERRVTALAELESSTEPTVLKLLNRISDLLFVWARLVNHRGGFPDASWQPRESRP